MYLNIAWNYLSKITDDDERTCHLTENGGEIRSVAIAGIRSAWVIRSRGAERLLTSNSTACFDRIVATVSRSDGHLTAPSGDGAALGYATSTAELGMVSEREVKPLVRAEGAPVAISVDAGRFAVLNRNGAIDLRSGTGALLGTIRDTGAAAISLRANHLVVLTRSGRLQVFGTARQAKLHDWAAPAGAASHVDAQYGVAVLTGRALAEIEPAGIAYAYNAGSQGHVRFVRFAEVERAVG